MAGYTDLRKFVNLFRTEVIKRLTAVIENQAKIIEQNEEILAKLGEQPAKRGRTKVNAD